MPTTPERCPDAALRPGFSDVAASAPTPIGTLELCGRHLIRGHHQLRRPMSRITAQLPGTTVITATIAQSSSSAGYFSTCPPASINVALANGGTKGVVTQGVRKTSPLRS